VSAILNAQDVAASCREFNRRLRPPASEQRPWPEAGRSGFAFRIATRNGIL